MNIGHTQCQVFKQNWKVRFQVLTAGSMQMKALRGIAPFSLVEVDRCFEGVYYLHHQGDEWRQYYLLMEAVRTSWNLYLGQ
jgi:hypothetical protein